MPRAFLPTTFYLGEDDPVGEQWEAELPLLPNGTGLLWREGRRFRVVDTWLSFDHHGHLDIGFHVFLEPVAVDDDRLRLLVPAYFEN
jgi:hypothetical protein